MGAAYDRDGQLLGEVQAESFREALDQLQEAHPHAAEYRLKDLTQANTAEIKPVDQADGGGNAIAPVEEPATGTAGE